MDNIIINGVEYVPAKSTTGTRAVVVVDNTRRLRANLAIRSGK